MKRRGFIKSAGLTGLGFISGSVMSGLLSACKKMGMMSSVSTTQVIPGNFDYPLPIPVMLQSNVNLIAQETNHQLFVGRFPQVLGYQSGSILGPCIVVEQDQLLNVLVQNNLPISTNVHFHGILSPSNMDGHPMDVIEPGANKSYQIQIKQRAGTYWYHPHPDQNTAKQVHLGLGGFLLVRDNEEASLHLPMDDREIPLIIQDKHVKSNGDLSYHPTMNESMTGFFGEYICANGAYSPFLSVKTAIYRFRIVNGSNARIYQLELSNQAAFVIIGNDGGLLSESKVVSSILLAPGERVDVLISFKNNQLHDELFLNSQVFSGDQNQGNESFSILKFKINETITDSFQIPSSLSVIPPLDQNTAIQTRHFLLAQSMGMNSSGMSHTINGATFDSTRIDFTVNAESTEIWEFDNSMGTESHPMHVHGVQFQILDRNGGRNVVMESEKGWKDTVLVMPNEKVRIILKFGTEKGTYILHCHNLEHEDGGMMAQYNVN